MFPREQQCYCGNVAAHQEEKKCSHPLVRAYITIYFQKQNLFSSKCPYESNPVFYEENKVRDRSTLTRSLFTNSRDVAAYGCRLSPQEIKVLQLNIYLQPPHNPMQLRKVKCTLHMQGRNES